MGGSTKQRLDMRLVSDNLAESRERAQRLIRAGLVRVDGVLFDKPGRPIPDDAAVTLKATEKYVSRGGLKLEAALQRFSLDVAGAAALDVGASTGGFTDCLLQHGAARVIAVDVGRGQLHIRLRNDPRVKVVENLNARYLKPDQVGEPVDGVVMDVSFISLRLTMPPALKCLKRGGFFVTLIKPQFEAGRRDVGRGGVVRDEAIHRNVIERIRTFGCDELGLIWRDYCASPIRGPAGNVEFLALWERP